MTAGALSPTIPVGVTSFPDFLHLSLHLLILTSILVYTSWQLFSPRLETTAFRMDDDDAPPQLVDISTAPDVAPPSTSLDTPPQNRVPITLVTGMM